MLKRLKCVPRMLAYRNSKLGHPLDSQELEDVAQETVLAIWNRLDCFAEHRTLEPWIHRFCTLEFMVRLRQRSKRPRLLGDASDAIQDPSRAEEFLYEEVYQSLDAVGPPGSDVVRYVHFERLTFDEVGVRMGVSANTAKTWYYRAIPKLRDRLASIQRVETTEGTS